MEMIVGFMHSSIIALELRLAQSFKLTHTLPMININQKLLCFLTTILLLLTKMRYKMEVAMEYMPDVILRPGVHLAQSF